MLQTSRPLHKTTLNKTQYKTLNTATIVPANEHQYCIIKCSS